MIRFFATLASILIVLATLMGMEALDGFRYASALAEFKGLAAFCTYIVGIACAIIGTVRLNSQQANIVYAGLLFHIALCGSYIAYDTPQFAYWIRFGIPGAMWILFASQAMKCWSIRNEVTVAA